MSETNLKAVKPKSAWNKALHIVWTGLRILFVIGLFLFILVSASTFYDETQRLENCQNWVIASSSMGEQGWHVNKISITPRQPGFQSEVKIGGHVQVTNQNGTVVLDQDWSTAEQSCWIFGVWGCSEIAHYSATVPASFDVSPNATVLVSLKSGEYRENLTLSMPTPSPPPGSLSGDRSLASTEDRTATTRKDGNHFSVSAALRCHPMCIDPLPDSMISPEPSVWVLATFITGIICGAGWAWRNRKEIAQA